MGESASQTVQKINASIIVYNVYALYIFETNLVFNDASMAPKRDNKKRKSIVSPRSMKLRSGCVPQRIIDQEASSRIRPLDTPKRNNRGPKRCVFIDDEAQVDEDSNNIEEQTEYTCILFGYDRTYIFF